MHVFLNLPNNNLTISLKDLFLDEFVLRFNKRKNENNKRTRIPFSGNIEFVWFWIELTLFVFGQPL